jgi:hypothetical protein
MSKNKKPKKKKSTWGIVFKDETQTTPVCLFKNVKDADETNTFSPEGPEGLMIYRFTTKKSFNPPVKYNLPRNKDLYKIVVARGTNLADFMEECPEFFF